MTDEPRDDDDGAEDESPPKLPEDDKGLGLTEEFARIEAEIDAELGRSVDLDAPDEVPAEAEAAEDDAAEDAPPEVEPAPVRWEDEDSAEWPVAPVLSTGPGGPEDLSDVRADEPAEPAEAKGDAEPAEEPADPEPTADEPALEHTVIQSRPAAPVAIAAGGYGGGGTSTYIADEDLEDRQPRLWWRFLTASVLIVAATATAVSVSSLLFLTDVAAKLQDIPGITERIQSVDPGEPQTILILGSDERDDTPGDPGRSDTTMLLRVDADKEVLSLFSLPRDLRVDIAGRNYGEGKLNEAYTYGGAPKTLETVQNLTGLEINHVVNIDFQGFADAVTAIGCVYVDIDRKYFNDNSFGEGYATIDINPGYQRLCGSDALDYVRYRHLDTTFVRDARQQDFLRNARAQVPVSELAPPVFGGGGKSSELIDIFTKYTSSSISTSAQIIGLLKSFLVIKDVPVNEVHFEASDELIDGVSYVIASDEQVDKAVDEFLGDKDSEGPRLGGNANQKSDSEAKAKPKKEKKEEPPVEDKAEGADVLSTGDSSAISTGGIDKYEAFGRTSARRLHFPIYIPNVVAPGSLYEDDSRQYEIMDPEDDARPSYKMVISLENPAVNLEYYGIQGTTWDDPPILEDPSETQTIEGRDYDLYYDGDRLRMVAFHDDGNAYWLNNTLLQTLEEDQMLAIATSMTQVKEPEEKKPKK